MTKWTTADIPPQHGRSAIVTGTGGLGYEPAAQGALPTLFAATSPDARSGLYYGPDKLGEVRGSPAVAKVPPQAQDTHAAARLWTLSEELAGLSFK